MRRIRIQPVTRDGNQLAVSFNYDPSLTAFAKTIPGSKWNAGAKVWLVPGAPETLVFIRDRKPPDVALTIDPGVIERFRTQVSALQVARNIREKGDSDIAHRWITTPYAHQRAGLAMLAHLGSGALLWEMGLGKSKTALDFAELLSAEKPRSFRVLIVTPNTVARNWTSEIQMHTGHNDYALLTGLSIARRTQLLASARYSIVNCEALAYKQFVDAVLAREWDLVIVDESTRFKNPKAARTKALLKLAKRAQHRVILTGTPITGSPEDAWAQMEFVQPGIFGSWYSFVDRFLVRDFFGNVSGLRPGMTTELAERIARRSYRVLKSQVLDLPPKVYADRNVTLAGVQEKAYTQMQDELRVQIAQLEEVSAANVLTVLLRLTQITSGLVGEGDAYTWIPDNAKVTELDALLNDELRGEQVVVFGLYQRELEELARRYVGWAPGLQYPPILYGPTPERFRHDLIAEFQRGDRRLLFAQIRTGGIGINLTAAKTAIYYSRSWSLEEYLQSQDRLHRIGQTGTVSILHLRARGTVDDEIADALASKQSLADSLTGDGARRLIASVLGRA
jgi:SNF2 family DNA or RNA helicase